MDRLLKGDALGELARRHHLDFICQTWQKKNDYIIGLHTRAICERLDRAFTDYKNGKDTFLLIQVPVRHGKSEIISHYLPGRFLGIFPDEEIICCSYNQEQANYLSRGARDLIGTDQYKHIFKNINLGSDAIERWSLSGYQGSSTFTGIGGSITGKGYALGFVDDYLKNREDAESKIIRESQWSWFTQVFLTRRGPVSITIVLATPWHVDDISGRIDLAMKEDPDFPRFETLRFPAESHDYPTGYLFPERFQPGWYTGQKAALKVYGTASLLQCNPIPKTGNVLDTAKFKIIEEKELPDDLRWARFWDLASSTEQKSSDDPDYTVGLLMGVRSINKEKSIDETRKQVYIKDIRRMQEEAPARNEIIRRTALADGDEVRIGVEAVGGYKDTYTIIQDVLKGIRVVQKIIPAKDKLTRCEPIQPTIDAGEFYIVRAPWNQAFIEELQEFPGRHDDQVDAMTGAYYMLKNTGASFDFEKHLAERKER